MMQVQNIIIVLAGLEKNDFKIQRRKYTNHALFALMYILIEIYPTFITVEGLHLNNLTDYVWKYAKGNMPFGYTKKGKKTNK